MGDDHRNFGAVLGGVEHLCGGVVFWVKVDFRLPVLLVLPGFNIVLVGRAWGVVVGEREVEFFFVLFSSKTIGCSHSGQFDVPNLVAVHIILVYLGDGIDHVLGKEVSSSTAGSQYVFGFGNKINPVLHPWVARVYRDNFFVGGVSVGHQEESAAFIVHHISVGFIISLNRD